MTVNQTIPPILPEAVIQMAWGLNLAYSGNTDKDATTTPDDITNNLKEITDKLQDQVSKKEAVRDDSRKALVEVEKSNPKFNDLSRMADTAEKELQLQIKHLIYVQNVRGALSSCERNLRSIIRGRDQNFAEADSLMKTQIANIESSARLAANLQSSVPRLFAAGGGASGTIFVNYILQSVFHYSIPPEVIAAGAVIIAGAVLGFFEWQVAPKNVERAQREIIKNKYRRNTYFAYYVDRVIATLEALLNQTLNIYQTVYGSEYDKFDQTKKQETVRSVIGGQEGICGKLCEKVNSHYYKDLLTPENWCSCETAIGCQECPNFKKQ